MRARKCCNYAFSRHDDCQSQSRRVNSCPLFFAQPIIDQCDIRSLIAGPFGETAQKVSLAPREAGTSPPLAFLVPITWQSQFAVPKTRGSPAHHGVGVQIGMRWHAEVQAIDRWRHRRPDSPARPETIRLSAFSARRRCVAHSITTRTGPPKPSTLKRRHRSAPLR